MKPRLEGMTYSLRLLGAVGVAAASTFIALPTVHAVAAPTPDNPCDLQGWYVNDDESTRTPTFTNAGLVFEGSDLIHHDQLTELELKDLKPGFFSASPAPDQPSFFSVEVRDETTDAYGTLRWNKVTAEWTLTTNTATTSKASPADFIGTQTKWGKLTTATRVITFGLGYTANPLGTVKTTVRSVTFQGKAYSLSCPPPTSSPSPTPSKSPTTSATPTPTRSSSVSPTSSSASPAPSSSASGTPRTASPRTTTSPPAVVPGTSTPDDELPITGSSVVPFFLVSGVALVVAGVLTVVGVRKRRRARH